MPGRSPVGRTLFVVEQPPRTLAPSHLRDVRSPYEAIGSCRSPAARRYGSAVARVADDDPRYGDHRERPPPLRPARVPLTPERSVLVPGPGLGHGDGLALVGHHHFGDERPEERTEP